MCRTRKEGSVWGEERRVKGVLWVVRTGGGSGRVCVGDRKGCGQWVSRE